MNFTSMVKNEIINNNLKKADRLAFLTAFIRASGSIIRKDDEIGFEIYSKNKEVIEKVAYFLRAEFDFISTVITVEKDVLNKKDDYVLDVFGSVAVDVLIKCQILVEIDGEYIINAKLGGEFLKTDYQKKAFIRGIFLGAGSCIIPNLNERNSAGYHLEIGFTSYDTAISFCEMLALFNIFPKLTKRKEGFIVYIKNSEEITDFLVLIGATGSALKVTETAIQKAFTNDVNRKKNCDLGNLNKQIIATEKYIDAINLIENTISLAELKETLRETAIKRKEFSEDTLEELAKRLNVTKSCLNHRLRKILEISKNLGDK